MSDNEPVQRSRASNRARRAAAALKRGEEIYAFIARPEIRKLLMAEADRGLPPVGALGERLLKKFGNDHEAKIKTLPVRQFIGMCTRAILEQAGYRVAQKGVRLNNNELFRVGSVYERIDMDPEPNTKQGNAPLLDLGEAMLARLSDTEALRAIRLIEQTHPGLRKKRRFYSEHAHPGVPS